MEGSDDLPSLSTLHSDEDWKIAPLPPRLQCQHLGLGDVSPSNSIHFITALTSGVDGVQVDFDDGHCPTWTNTVKGKFAYKVAHIISFHNRICEFQLCNSFPGLHNVIAFTKGVFHPDEVPTFEKAPVLMLRPRAWNMPEHNIFVS